MSGSKFLMISSGATLTSAPLSSIIGITQELTKLPFKIEAGSIIRDGVPYKTNFERNSASAQLLVSDFSDTFALLAVVTVTVRSMVSVRDKSKSVDR